MLLRSVVRDCLYLNWAHPLEELPEAPPPLRYQSHSWEGRRWVFVTALLFRQQELHLPSLPWVRLSYPQFNLRLCVLDEDGVPAVLFRAVLAPGWVVPAARLLTRRPVRRAFLDYPASSPTLEEGGCRWGVRRGGESLGIRGRPGASVPGPGPSLGDWEDTVAYVRQRERGYSLVGKGLQQVETTHETVAAQPMAVELEETGLLARFMPSTAVDWRLPHSAWICPEAPYDFELSRARETPVGRQVPAPG